MKFVNFLKRRLIFNICYCFWIFVNKRFTYLTCAYLRKWKVILMWNLQHIIFIWRERNWEIFKSASVYLYISAFNFRIWFGKQKIPCKQKYWNKKMAKKIPILILFCFCLFCWLSPVSIVAAGCFNYIGSRIRF